MLAQLHGLDPAVLHPDDPVSKRRDHRVVRDDDGPCKIFWRIDKNEYRELPEMGTSFAIDVDFDTLTDNEHIINVYAVDINGVKGNIEERKFKVSTEEPKGSVDSPSIDIAVKDVITVRGVTSDKNGIEKARNDSIAVFYAGNVTDLYKRQTDSKKEN